MLLDIKIPSPGESITEVTISHWLKNDGDYVNKDEEILEIESDKATLTVSAEQSGVLRILSGEGEIVKVGSAAGKIDTEAKVPEKLQLSSFKSQAPSPKSQEKPVDSRLSPVASSQQPVTEISVTPLAKKIMEENKIFSEKISGTGEHGKITKVDVLNAMSKGSSVAVSPSGGGEGGGREEQRQKMSPLRKKLSQRLVAVKNQTAMLTTFNEIDMSKILELRAKHNPVLEKQYGIKLGFMSFFTKAVCEAIQLFPAVNASIEGDDIVYHNYCDIGIAVSAPKGLVVPVVRNAEKMTLIEIETEIKQLAEKARNNKLIIEEMTGGTFTISNGGVFGSLLSTPILNPPQSAILGMHNIVERPVAVPSAPLGTGSKIEIRPMMYVALSYDHRIIDGRESVGFLVQVKELCENPEKLFSF